MMKSGDHLTSLERQKQMICQQTGVQIVLGVSKLTTIADNQFYYHHRVFHPYSVLFDLRKQCWQSW